MVSVLNFCSAHRLSVLPLTLCLARLHEYAPHTSLSGNISGARGRIRQKKNDKNFESIRPILEVHDHSVDVAIWGFVIEYDVDCLARSGGC